MMKALAFGRTGRCSTPRILRSVSALILPAVVFCTSFGAGSVSLADQRAAELPGLFDELQNATSPSEARRIESMIWEHWLDSPDQSSGLLMSQVSSAMASGELDLALLFCNQLVDGAPEFAEGWNKRATVHYLMGNNAESVADIRETLALEPRHFGAISGLGMIFLREQNIQGALDAFEQVLLISPGSLSARQSVEYAKRELGREI